MWGFKITKNLINNEKLFWHVFDNFNYDFINEDYNYCVARQFVKMIKDCKQYNIPYYVDLEKKLNENLEWVKHYRDKYYEEITKFRDEIFKTTEVQNAINRFEREKEQDIRREAERKIEEFKKQKYIEDINAIEKIVKIKNLDERFKLIADQKKEYYFFSSDDLYRSFLRETLLALKQCEDENEGVKAELNLQVSANYLLVKEIEELKKTNIINLNK